MAENAQWSSHRMIAILPSVLIVLLYAQRVVDLQIDDALIYLRYVRNFHEGVGLVYNEGVRFNGMTSPLYVYFLIAVSYISPDYQSAMIFCSTMAMIGAVVVGSIAFSDKLYTQFFTGVMIASFGFFYFTFGMETPLFLFFIAASLYLFRIKSDYLLIAVALAFITRGEGVFLGVLPLAAAFSARRLPPISIIGVSVLIAATPMVINFLYFGEFLAATASAKVLQGESGLWGDGLVFLNIGWMLDAIFGQDNIAIISFVGLAVAGAVLGFREKTILASIVFAFILITFYTIMNIPGYHWYFGPVFFIMLMTSGYAVGEVLNSNLFNMHRYRVFVMIVGFALAMQVVQTTRVLMTGANQAYVDAGRWLEANTEADETVAMVEIGTVGWYSRRQIVDILGLVNPYNAQFIGERKFSEWLRFYQPDYILVHDPIWPHEQSAAQLEARRYYEEAGEFQVSGLRLLKKNPMFDSAEAIEYVESVYSEDSIIAELLASDTVGAPYIVREGAGLFAHAPSELTFDISADQSILEIEYGLRATAVGHHSGVCFEISSSAGERFWSDCFAPNDDDHIRSAIVELHASSAPRVHFKTTCQAACSNAWTMWYSVEALGSPDNR